MSQEWGSFHDNGFLTGMQSLFLLMMATQEVLQGWAFYYLDIDVQPQMRLHDESTFTLSLAYTGVQDGKGASPIRDLH